MPQLAGDSLRPSGLPVAQLMDGNWVSAATISAIASVWATSPSLACQLHHALIARGDHRNRPLTTRTETMVRPRGWAPGAV